MEMEAENRSPRYHPERSMNILHSIIEKFEFCLKYLDFYWTKLVLIIELCKIEEPAETTRGRESLLKQHQLAKLAKVMS